MAGLNETVDEIFGNGSITNTAIATPVTLTLGGFDSPGDFSGTISAGAAGTGGLDLVKTGTATQTFSGVLN